MSNLKTRWTDNVNYDCPLSEYPRPQLVRNDWQCLNGKFEFTITGMTDDIPQDFDGEIVVPFAPEWYLSGIERTIEPQKIYTRRLLRRETLYSSFRGC